MSKRGRKPVQFSDKDRAEIKHLAGLTLSVAEIARIKGCSEKTLMKSCAEEIDSGRVQAKAMAVNQLFLNIKKGKEASIFFYLKTQHHWRERQEVQHTGTVGFKLIIEGE